MAPAGHPNWYRVIFFTVMEGHAFHLVRYEEPYKKLHTERDIVSFRSRGPGIDTVHSFNGTPTFPYHACPFKAAKEGDKVIVLKVTLTYAQNDYNEHASFTLSDNLGVIHVPALWRGTMDTVVYEPNLVNLGIPVIPYVGLEQRILNVSSTCVSHKGVVHDYLAFHPTDPLLVFLLSHMNHFAGEVRAGDMKRVSADAYLVRRHLVESVQRLFRDSIFPLFHYTVEPSLRFQVKSPVETAPVETHEPSLLFALEVDYLVVSPGHLMAYKMK